MDIHQIMDMLPPQTTFLAFWIEFWTVGRTRGGHERMLP